MWQNEVHVEKLEHVTWEPRVFIRGLRDNKNKDLYKS